PVTRDPADEVAKLSAELTAARAEIRRLRDQQIDLELAMSELQETQTIVERNRKLEQEMELANRIQTSMLPGALTVAGLEIAGRMRPAAMVGGDYYDVQPVSDGCWIAIGDDH